MYEEFYGFKEKPFSVTPDPRFLFLSPGHRDALAYLRYGIDERKGFLAMVGEVGVGKTTIVRAMLDELSERVEASCVLTTRLTFKQLLELALHDLGLDVGGKTKVELLIMFNEFLIEKAQQGKSVVLVVDEAQNLSAGCLEELRMLSNLETDRSKLLQTVLVGQPELKRRLSGQDLRQLRQRIPGLAEIKPLEYDDVRGYINFRLSVAGLPDPDRLFSPGALEAIYRYSRGIPRLINLLCDRSLLAGFVDEIHYLEGALVDEAFREIFGVEEAPRAATSIAG